MSYPSGGAQGARCRAARRAAARGPRCGTWLLALAALVAASNYMLSATWSGMRLPLRASEARGKATAMRAASGKERRSENVAGALFVDHSCIDCDTCRWMAPETFSRENGQSMVYRQPGEEHEDLAALAAAVACPTGSIRIEKDAPGADRLRSISKSVARESFPVPVDQEKLPGVYHLGYHSPKSFGATTYFITGKSKDGTPLNVMVDSPRYNSKLADRLAEMGGVQLLLLSHKDDVADHNRWKERFPEMVRVMHKADIRGPDMWPYIDMQCVEKQLEGDGPWELAPGLTVVYTPGHSAGSISFLAETAFTGAEEGALFTGDHLAFSARLGRLDGFARYGWNIPLQSESMSKLATLPFAWLLPGHGRRWHFESDDERHESIVKCAEEFKDDPLGNAAPGPVFEKQLQLV